MKKKIRQWAQRQWLIPVILFTWEAEIGRTVVFAGLGQKAGPVFKITRAKRDEGMAQVVACLAWSPEFKSQYRTHKKVNEPGMVVCTCNPSTWEVEVGGA
jgi:hypothetical protein